MLLAAKSIHTLDTDMMPIWAALCKVAVLISVITGSLPYAASVNPSNSRILLGWRIFLNALASIWRMRSRVT